MLFTQNKVSDEKDTQMSVVAKTYILQEMAGDSAVCARSNKGGGTVKKRHVKMKNRAMSMVIPQGIFAPNEVRAIV